MAANFRGDQLIGLRRQTGDTFRQLEDGSWNATTKYVGRWPDIMYYAPMRNATPHPDFPALICISCEANRLKPGNVAELYVTYRGFIAKPQDDGKFNVDTGTEEVVAGTSEAPIETHPKFVSDIGGSKLSPIAGSGAIFDENGKFLGFAADSPFAGIDSYLYPSTTYRRTFSTSGRPTSLSGVGKINSDVPIS